MSKKGQRQKNLTATFIAGGLDEDRLNTHQRFTQRSKDHQQNRTLRTSLLRAAEAEQIANVDALPCGRVVQVHSVYSDVEIDGSLRLCVVRKTLHKVSETRVVVGDMVRVSEVQTMSDAAVADALPTREGVIERIEARRSILTRADVRQERDKIVGQIPIIANAEQMLIVASLLLPRISWGLIDRMIVAARAGDVEPIVCLNKIDLADGADARAKPIQIESAVAEADEVLGYYTQIGVRSVRTSVRNNTGIEQLRTMLTGKLTALTGHSGVGKSSLISAVQPSINIKTGEISNYNQKGRHTTTSAKIYHLDGGGSVVDTPGVRLFGLWNQSAESLALFYPDIEAGSAPPWRVESYRRILASLPPAH